MRLRFRSDVPVGINLSGGLDSSTLLGLLQAVQGAESDVKAFTFVTGAPQYDELPWVERMLAQTRHPSVTCRLEPGDVPDLAESVQGHQGEPFGGLPTLAHARLFERARAEAVIVLLDGQGMDDKWAGYHYYQAAMDGTAAGLVQGAKEKPVRPECLVSFIRRPSRLTLSIMARQRGIIVGIRSTCATHQDTPLESNVVATKRNAERLKQFLSEPNQADC